MTSNRFTTFDAVMLALGAVFFALSVLSVVATITVLLDPRTAEEWSRTGPGFISFAKGFGLVFFPLAALVTLATGMVAGRRPDQAAPPPGRLIQASDSLPRPTLSGEPGIP